MPVFHRLVAAAVAAIALLVPAARWIQYRTSPIGTLVAAAPREHRPTLARVAGFPYAPHAPMRGGVRRPEQLELDGAAGRVLARTQNLDTVKARHAAGVAHLLIGQTSEGVEQLERAAGRSNDARVWNDLAAARYTVGEERSLLVDALAAADRAIALDPDLAEAHFNRALILEKLGLSADAAWQRYLALDPSSEWSTEARARLRKAPRKQGAFDPFDARRRGEMLLVEWGTAELRGDGAAKLAEVRALARRLAEHNGDLLLADAVAAIDRASGAQRITLADAHRRYREEGAADALRAAGSPLAGAAAHRAAVLLFNGNRPAEARRVLTELLPRVDATRHRSLAADIHHTLTNCATVTADWGSAVREGSLASAAFEELGEPVNAAFMTAAVAHALERMGRPDQAWREWARAFDGTRDHPRKHGAVLHAAGLGLAAMQRHAAAQAMFDVLVDLPGQVPVTIAAVSTEGARAALHGGDAASADRWLRDARDAARRIEKDDARALAEAQLDVAEGVRHMAAEPRAALARLDRAVTFFAEKERRIDLADAHLQRGRAWRAAGNDDAALADFEAALRQVGREGSMLFADTAEQIVDETIELHLDRGDGRRAFALADRAHASLADVHPAAIPAGTALVEYQLLPRRVAIFCLTREGLTTVTVSVPRRELAERVASLAGDIRARRPVAEIRAKAQALHRVLVAPLRLTDVDELVLVADRQLQALPFAVLFDGERYLVEHYTIRYAPSAAQASPTPATLTPAVAISDPAVAGWPSLPHSRDEAAQVAAVHGASVIAGAEVTRARFLESLQGSALVHYAGHADSNAGAYGALLLAPSGGDAGILAASDIARLTLHAHAPLVVLSACGTLRGETRHVAGMPTLARAFLTAGARAVVGTQWEVEDDLTTPLFVHFHQELHAGQAPARALRSAQIAMLQTSDPRSHHPAAWSAVAVLSNV
ncbi:MAG TPA: CHAT domain-containing protein [Thermoanaerobaculia bacterium]